MDESSTANHGPTPTNGRIMVVSVVIIFIALLIIAFFHVYTRWYLVNRRRRRRSSTLHNHRRVSHWPRDEIAGQGLPPTILKALPTFLYSMISVGPEADSPECAVCLSEFVDGETGRVLPKCKHWFHVDCIDMWFRTHSNCPLCRAPVQNPDGTLVILVDGSSDGFTLPAEWSSFVHRKLPELTSIRVEAPVSSSGSGWPPASK